MYKKVNVELQFRDKIHGGLPKDKEILKAYVSAKFGSDDTTLTETDLDLEEELEKVQTGFRKDETGLYIGGYQIKAALKQYASLLKLTVKKRGTKQTFAEGMFIKGMDAKYELTGDKLYFAPIRKEPDGTEDIAGNVSTPQGRRSILSSSEYVQGAILRFQIWVLDVRTALNSEKELTLDDIEMCFDFGQECGLGSRRVFETGKYDVTRFDPVPAGK